MEKEVLDFYRDIGGTKRDNLRKIDIADMWKGKQLSVEHCNNLTAKVTEKEIFYVVKSINDLTAPSIDGFGAKLFKVTWPIIKRDIQDVVWDFFRLVGCIRLLIILW